MLLKRVSLFLASLLRVESLKYSAALLWNNHLKIDDKINLFNKVGPFKRYLKIYLYSLIMTIKNRKLYNCVRNKS